MGYTKEVIKGVSWIGGFNALNRLGTVIRAIVLARILSPVQFGLFGIAFLVLAFLETLTETGVNVFLIQKDNIEEYIDSAWTVSIIRGFLISFAMILFSPLIVAFFRNKDAYSILLVAGLIPLLRGFINPAIIKFQKNLEFNKEVFLRISVFLIDFAVSLSLALITRSALSLVFGMAAGVVLEVILSFMLLKPIPRLSFNLSYLRQIANTSKWVTSFGIFSYFGQRADDLTVGRIINTETLGVYQMAYRIATLPVTEVTDVVNKVSFPTYVKIKNDKKRLFRAFGKVSFLIALVTIPIALVLFLFPKEIITILLGDRWAATIPVLRILSLYGLIRAVFGSSSALFLSIGKERYVTFMTFTRFIAIIVTIIPLTMRFGVIGAGYSALISSLVEIPVILYFVKKSFK